MQAAGIVEALDISEEVSVGLGAGAINPTVNPLGPDAEVCVTATSFIGRESRQFSRGRK
jgi:hypothetical protein